MRDTPDRRVTDVLRKMEQYERRLVEAESELRRVKGEVQDVIRDAEDVAPTGEGIQEYVFPQHRSQDGKGPGDTNVNDTVNIATNQTTTDQAGGQYDSYGYGSHAIAWDFSFKITGRGDVGPTTVEITPGYIWLPAVSAGVSTTTAVLCAVGTVNNWPTANQFIPGYRFYFLRIDVAQNARFGGKLFQFEGADAWPVADDVTFIFPIVDFRVSGGVAAGVVNSWIQRGHMDCVISRTA